jgi:hypothetical protein
MPKPCTIYYITDRKAFPGDELTRRSHLLDKITEAASAGIDYIQLREKDLSTRDLESLAREAIEIIWNNKKSKTALLINSRTDVALATEAHGVHLPANDLSPKEIRQIWKCGAGALARERTHRPRSSPGSVPSQDSSPRSWRHHPAERRVLPASRSSRHRRYPPLPGKQHRRYRPHPARKLIISQTFRTGED